MAEHAIKQQKPQKNAVAVARKVVKKAVANTEEQGGAKIVVLTADPHRNVVIVPGCHLDSMRQEENVYFLEDGNVLVGMIVEGGTVEYHPADRTYVVRLTNGRHAWLNRTTDMAQTEAVRRTGERRRIDRRRGNAPPKNRDGKGLR